MKNPFNYAVLKYFTTVSEASGDDVFEALKRDYAHLKYYSREAVYEILLTGELNGFLQETRYKLRTNGQVEVFYTATAEEQAVINKYIA